MKGTEKNDDQVQGTMNIKVSYFPDTFNGKELCDITLKQFTDVIKESRGIAQLVKLIREEEDEAKQKELKLKLPMITPSGTFLSSRTNNGLLEHSNIICIDIDDLGDVELIKTTISQDDFVLACFVSPRGRGLKIFTRIDGSKHLDYWKQIADYYHQKFGLAIDTQCKNVSRGCFYSYDPNIYVNWDAKYFPFEKEFDYGNKQKEYESFEFEGDLYERVEKVIEKIEEEGVDITSTYSNWITIGFALSDGFGEEGRDFFHLISSNHPKYNKHQCDKQYDHCLKNQINEGEKTTVGSFFFLAKEHGIEVETAETAETAGQQFGNYNSKTPFIPDKVYDLIPDILKQLTHNFKGRARDIVLTSSISVLSATFPNTKGLYRNKYYFPNIFTLIIAPSGSDKGRAELAKRLASKIDKEIRDEYIEAKKGDSNILKRCHIIPGNTSSADIELILIGSGNGIIAESELDVLANNFKQDWGDFSHILRQAFEHESITRSRKDEDISKVDTPKLSVSLTGTFNQAPTFFDNLEDGLYNRFGIYTFSEAPSFENPFIESVNYGEVFDKQADEVLKLYHEDIKIGGSNFSFTKKQEEQFFKIYRNWDDIEYIQIGGNSKGVLWRLAVQQFKIAMLLSKLRNPTDQNLICTEDDYQASLMIIDTFMSHTVTLYNLLKNKLLKLDAFYELLPSEFTTGKAISIGKDSMDISERTIHDKLNNYIQKGALLKVKHGHYKKL